ncbi:MAG TPA: divalent-cation tolerance protein CutA [Candidatus Bathyarchaeia archaeon]|nr:divalent-cation tolerance protein CutA [Candidatus Bathyarchaeia archaeon]
MAPIIVFVTTASKREAQRIVQTLLEQHLIACANILGPTESHFWWQGKIARAKEFLVIMKSDQKLFLKLSKAVKEAHSYDVPEIVAVPIEAGFKPYLEWLDGTLAKSGES